MGEVRVAVFIHREGGGIVGGGVEVSHILHQFHGDARHQAILYEEIDRLIAAALLKGAPDIQIVMGNQRIPIRLLETVQQRSFRLILLARVIGVHHKGLFVTDADATGRPEAGGHGGNAADGIPGGLPLLRVGLKVDVVHIQPAADRVVDGGQMEVRALRDDLLRSRQMEGGVKGEGHILISQSQELIPFPAVRPGNLPLQVKVRRGLSIIAYLPRRRLVDPVEKVTGNQNRQQNAYAQEEPPLFAGVFRRHRFLRRFRQLRHGNAQFPGQPNQVVQIRGREVGLPFADGLPADAQSGTQLLLRNIQLFSIQADALSKCHIAFSFHRGIGGISTSVYHTGPLLATTRLSTIGCGRKKDRNSNKNRSWNFPAKIFGYPLSKRRKIR